MRSLVGQAALLLPALPTPHPTKAQPSAPVLLCVAWPCSRACGEIRRLGAALDDASVQMRAAATRAHTLEEQVKGYEQLKAKAKRLVGQVCGGRPCPCLLVFVCTHALGCAQVQLETGRCLACSGVTESTLVS